VLAYIDGPEKAGKTTIVNILRERYGATVRHWGPIAPDDRVYAEPLLEDSQSDAFTVWDRGWASEHVYGALMGRTDRRLRDDPWLGEWLYGRAFQTIGTRFILLGPNALAVASLREGTDLPVDPAAERAAYAEYGRRFGYTVMPNQHTTESAEGVAWLIYQSASIAAGLASANHGLRPPAYAGPPNARVVFVGERPGPGKVTFPGHGLPFTSRMTIQMARDLGDFALECGWTNTSSCPPQALRTAGLLVACGKEAEMWVTHNVAGRRVLRVDHPAYIYRFGKQVDRLTAHRETLNHIKEEFSNG
jgi:hypothetical protein